MQLFPKAEGRTTELKITVAAGATAPARGQRSTRPAAAARTPASSAATRRCWRSTAPSTRDPIVLLHAYAGSGKTTTAAEFARWYALTGGVDGPVLFTSFEQLPAAAPRARPARPGLRAGAGAARHPLAGARRRAAARRGAAGPAAGAGALGLGQRRAGGRLPGRHGRRPGARRSSGAGSTSCAPRGRRRPSSC